MKKLLVMLLTLVLVAGAVVLSISAEAEPRMADCPYCQKAVEWQPLTASAKTLTTLEGGHYYLVEDLQNSYQKSIAETTCLDLNGKTINSSARSFLVNTANSVLNIMDSQEDGAIVSESGSNNAAGGTITSSKGGTVNLYSGTLCYKSTDASTTTKGGVININGGNVNIYGGTVDASECTLVGTEGGAAIAMNADTTLNISGGQIIAGKKADGGVADCILVDATTAVVTLSGDAKVDELYFTKSPETSLVIDGKYTGEVKLAYAEAAFVKEGAVIGQIINNADISGAKMQSGVDDYFIDIMGGELVLTRIDPSCEASVIGGSAITNCETLEEALSSANGKRIQLNKSISTDVSIAQDTYLDLNGCSITGKLTVDEGKTLYCMDSETDDYTVADGKYGKLTNVDGKVAGMPLNSGITVDEYRMITDSGEISFHRIGLQLTAMTLRSSVAGVYYKSEFGVDEMVAKHIQIVGYGVALSVVAEPTEENLETSCKYTSFTDFSPGGMAAKATSTLLTGVMREKNPALINYRNANMPVYGKAYFLLDDGTYLFGAAANRSFREQVEAVSDIWDSLTKTKKDDVYAMYDKYSSVIDNWDAVNIHAYKDPSRDDVLKILNISNSHGQDSVWLIPEVLKAESPDTKFLVAECYASYALQEHIQSAQNNSTDYTYWTNTGDGWSEGVKSSSLQALQAQNWDIVMFNESSRHLGLERVMKLGRIDTFREYIESNIDYELPALLYNMTWASPTADEFYDLNDDDDRQAAPEGFRDTYENDYGFDHVNHYNQLVALTKKYLVDREGFDKIIYNATPVQYASEICGVPQYDVNQTYDLYRDYTHLSDYARLIVAYNWYCQMFDVDKLTEVKVHEIKAEDRAAYSNRQKVLGDLTLTEQHKKVLIESVNHSLENPLSIEKAE